jgi:hypothetical protein
VEQQDGKRCPGEAICQKGEEEYYLLARPGAGEADEATGTPIASMICPNCPLFSTKQGSEPRHVAEAISVAMEHEEEVKNGYRFGDRNELTPLEWASVKGLSRGRARFEEWLEAHKSKEVPVPAAPENS